MSMWDKRPQEDVETERARLMARADAAGHEATIRRVQRNATRQERAEARRLQREERTQRRQDRATTLGAGVAAVRQRLILILPLLGVNVLALGGQIGFATQHLGWNLPQAAVFGAVLESIAVYIGWHAHQALLSGDSAIKLRASSYLMGAVVGGLNYDHFAGANWSPSAKAVVFGLMSLTSPWLWAMHGRYANRKRIRELGLIDERAPHFSGGRWVHFPVQTWGALRWGIANNVQDPAAAWNGYQESRRRKTTEPAKPLPSRSTEPRTVPLAQTAAGGSVEASRAIEAPRPSPRTKPTEPGTVPAAKPTAGGTVSASQASQAATEPSHSGAVPPELRPGVKAPNFVIVAAREIYEANPKLTDRKLAIATRDRFKVPYAVIGRSACQTIIADYERAEETG